jgi:phage FluMu gp28-like protein
MLAVGNALPRFAGCAVDAGGNGGFCAEEATDAWGGLMVESIHFTEQFYRDEFPKYKAGFEDRLISIVQHDDVLEDHRAVKLVRGVPRVPEGKTDKAGERHGDSAIAGLLADYRSRADVAPIDFEATGHKRMAADDVAIHEHAGFGSVGGSNDFTGYA